MRRLYWAVAFVGIFTASAHARQGVSFSQDTEFTRGTIGNMTQGNDLLFDYARLMAWDLRLDAAQRGAVVDLYEGFRAQWIEAEEKIRPYAQAVREQLAGGPDPELEAEEQDAWRRFEKFRTRIREQLNEDIKSILTDEQLARWPLVERSASRFWMLQNVEGEPIAKIDLARLAERATRKTSPSDAVVELADRYAQEMSVFAEEYQKWWKEWWPRQSELKREGDENWSTTWWHMTQQGQRRFMTRVGDLNESYAPRFAALMTPEQQESFLREYVLLAVQSGWRRSEPTFDIEDTIARVRVVTGLSQDARAEIERIAAEYHAELLRIQLARIPDVREHERKLLEVEDANEVRRQRWSFPHRFWEEEGRKPGVRVVEQLRALLTPEQLETMPPPLGVKELVPPVFE